MEHNLGIGSRIRHPKLGEGVIINVRTDAYQVTFMQHGYREIPAGEELEVIDDMAPDTDLVSLYEVERSLKKILQRWSDISEETPMGDRWEGGKMILVPGKSGLQNKEIPLEQFFHKIVMVRDRIRVMEQRINASELSDEEKVNLQQYITRIYGSLTTFNALFRHPHDQFTGEKGKE